MIRVFELSKRCLESVQVKEKIKRDIVKGHLTRVVLALASNECRCLTPTWTRDTSFGRGVCAVELSNTLGTHCIFPTFIQ